jgi:hypothetical protein
MCTSTPSTRRRAMRRSQSSEPKHTRAIATTRYPTAVGCRRFLPTGPACCAVGACRGCKRRGTPACWTFGSRGIRSAPVVERSGLRERCTGSWRIETSRRGLTHEVAAERATTGHARRAGSSGDAFSGPRDPEPTVLGASSPWRRSPPLPLVPLILDHNAQHEADGQRLPAARRASDAIPRRRGAGVKFVACGVVARFPEPRQLGQPIGLHAKNFCMSDRHEVLADVAAAERNSGGTNTCRTVGAQSLRRGRRGQG